MDVIRLVNTSTSFTVPSLEEYLEANSIPIPESGCIIWEGHISGCYGLIVVNGKSIGVHRLAYELAYGPIPNGLLACHRCDVTYCINPQHIFPGTQVDNQQDTIKKQRAGILRFSARAYMGKTKGTYFAQCDLLLPGQRSQPHLLKSYRIRHVQ